MSLEGYFVYYGLKALKPKGYSGIQGHNGQSQRRSLKPRSTVGIITLYTEKLKDTVEYLNITVVIRKSVT